MAVTSMSPYIRPRERVDIKALEDAKDCKRLAIRNKSIELLKQTLDGFQESLTKNNLYMSGTLLQRFNDLRDQTCAELYKLENKECA